MGLLLCTTAASYAAGKTALVLAVQDYQNLPKSSIGVKRAADIADALTALGYDVIQNANPTNAAARASLRDFAHKAETADVALAFLIGHGVAWGGQTFFLPANVEIGRATDLLSRGISVSNVAQIVSKAAAAGVFVLTTSPEFPSPIEGIDKRPQFTGAIDKNVVAVFPSSGRVPVSRIDAMGEQAADALATAMRQRDPGFADVVKAGANGETGTVVGAPMAMSLSKPVARAPAIENAALVTSNPDTRANPGRLEAERQGRENAEKKAKEEQARVEEAQAQVQRAQAEARKAQADAERAQAEAQKAIAEAERMKAEARRVQTAAIPGSEPTSGPGQAIADEQQIGARQRQRLQIRLKEMGLYTGPIDAVFGRLTREAIMGYQKSRGASVSGYLTPDQYDALLGNDR